MIKVSLIAKTDETPDNLISHAAKTCYTSLVPEMGNTMDIENNLFKTGHHTTLQHNYFTFNIEGLSVSSTIFGLHLTHSFYNSDQRSGRYSKMYTKPNYEEIKNYILNYWPNCDVEKAIEFIKKGREIYKNNIKKATEIAIKFIKEERPNVSEEYIEANAGKIAQEQMRMFLSTIFPTSLDHTLNLSAVTSLYRSAWSPEMRDITKQMKNLILEKYPNLDYMFDEKVMRNTNWTPKMEFEKIYIKQEPEVTNIAISFSKELNLNSEKKDSVDLNYFTPEKMENNISMISLRVEVSLATMGQDQRHRTINRGVPEITGNFYLPPIPFELGLKEISLDYMNEYRKLTTALDKNLVLALAPYGLMASYGKYGDLNSMIHEQEKRLCWSAQEEIYNLSRKLHEKLEIGFDSNGLEKDVKKVANLMTPACYHKSCIEGRRYCGRDLLILKNDKSMPKRKI